MARRFGVEGFAVALLARNQARVDSLADELAAEGIAARGFTADVRDPASISATLERVTEDVGPIEILQYSPLPQKDLGAALVE